MDGNGYGDANPAFLGIGYRNAGGVVDNSQIISIINTPPYTSEFGYGLFALADNGIDRALTISNSNFIIFQKNATGFLGKNLTATIDGNTITGAGPLNTLTQNGIQISFAATGSIKNNKIKNLSFIEESSSASGILVIDARSPVTISNNELNDCQSAIYLINTDGTIAQNKIIFTKANMGSLTYWYGILVRNGTVAITANELNGDGYGTGIDGFTSAENEVTKITATYNSIQNFETGISTEADAPNSCASGEIHYNSILNTPESLYNNQDTASSTCGPPNGGCNWFGTASAPEIAAKIIGDFNYEPWLTNGTDLQPGVTGFQPAGSCDGHPCSKLDDADLKETFPTSFNTGFYKSLVNKTFTGSTGTWTANSNDNATIVVTVPYYSPSTTCALKVVNFKTTNCGNGWAKAVSPQLDLTGPCCPDNVKFNFTLWTYNVVCNDTKAKLEIDFSNDNGVTWTTVYSKTSGQLWSLYGASGKTAISIPVSTTYQNSNFRYRVRGEMEAGDCNNFYVFLDDINFSSPAVCPPLGSIGDYVWNDLNGNGQQDAGEPALQNVTVKLTLPNGTTQTKTTNASGFYSFTGLAGGNYTVTFTTPVAFTPTLSNQGTNDAIDSDPVAGIVTVTLASGQNINTIDAGFKAVTCTNTTNHTETFPTKFNTYFTTSLCNKTFIGSSGTWTVNSNAYATMVVTTPYYAPSTTYALKVVNFKTTGCSSGWTKAVSPKVDLSNPCCPSELKMNFTLWTYYVVANDNKARLEIDFSNNNGATWTEVWSRTSSQLRSSYGANGKTMISLPVPVGYQNANFKYRIRGEMDANDCNYFYVFIDDIKVGSPASCSNSASSVARSMSAEIAETTETISINSKIATNHPKVPVETVNKFSGDFAVRVFPNPSSSEFELNLTSKEAVTATIRVIDMMGRTVQSMKVSSNQSIRFGKEFKSGSYLVEIIQGERKEVVKLLKM